MYRRIVSTYRRIVVQSYSVVQCTGRIDVPTYRVVPAGTDVPTYRTDVSYQRIVPTYRRIVPGPVVRDVSYRIN